MLNGLLPPLEAGRRCHERDSLLGGVFPCFEAESVPAGASFSLVGESERAMLLSRSTDCCRDSLKVADGESSLTASERLILRALGARGDGVLAGDDFWGEMDLARSVDCKSKISN